jgi:hypothetical protein
MKKFIFTVFILIPFLLPAQNYKNICTQGLTFYKKYNSNNVKAYRIDSLGLPGSSDTIFKSFRIIIDTNYVMCGDTTKGSILGRKVYKKNSNGYFFFFNKNNDTIFVNTQANVGDLWMFYQIGGSTYLQAEVTGIEQDTVLGILDNVKTIKIQGKRSDGTNFPHIFNGKIFKISEHYGLQQTFNMVVVPWDTTSYELAGKTHPALGIQEFGWPEVYNFQIADQFHYTGYHFPLTGSGGAYTTWLAMKTILTKVVHGNNDSVTYTYEYCKRTHVVSTGQETSTVETLTKTYNFVQLATNLDILRMPDEFIRRNIYASGYDRMMNKYGDRQTKEVGSDKYRFMNNCWVLPEGATINNNWYTEGVGISEYYKKNSNFIEDESIVYLKKGSEIWGIPVASDCNTLVAVDETPAGINTRIRVVPNPVNTRAEIQVEGVSVNTSLQAALFDHTGRMLYSSNMIGGSLTFDRTGIAAGLYILRISGEGINATTKIVLE